MPCDSPKARFGFTLVELLVVISLIALLVGVLIPELSKAQEQARRSVCASSQRQIVNAWETYAVDAGALPIMNRQGFDINYRRVSSGVYERHEIPGNGFGPETWSEYVHPKAFWYGAPFRGIIFQVDIHPGMSPTNFGQWRNFGLLIQDKSITDPRGLFCPSQRDPFYAWDTPYNPWPPAYETARRPDHPTHANHTESSYERRMGLTGVPWDRIPPRTVLVTDRLLDDEDAPGIVRETHRVGVNAAFRDGHVAFIKDAKFKAWMPDAVTWNEWQRNILKMYDWLDHQFDR
jgi:prepilin-type N-terminal cleavage/methylation domain-containing protein